MLQESTVPQNSNTFVTTLNNPKLKELDCYYRRTDSTYCTLIDAYEKERNAAKKKRLFPPLTSWLAKKEYSADQVDLFNGPSATIECYQTYTIVNDNGIYVKYSSCESHSNFDSSYIHLNRKSPFHSGNLMFGRIQMIFKHRFNRNERILVYVTWFESTFDLQSGLYSLDTEFQLQAPLPPIISIYDLSKPLIHACETKPNRVWILNF